LIHQKNNLNPNWICLDSTDVPVTRPLEPLPTVADGGLKFG
jgi:hypothetical protein